MIKAKNFFKKMVCVLALMSLITMLCCSSLVFSAYAQENVQKSNLISEDNISSNPNLEQNQLLTENELAGFFSQYETDGQAIQSFDEYLENKGTSVEQILDERVTLYKKMLDNCGDDEIQEGNLHRLIEATEKLKSATDEKIDTLSISTHDNIAVQENHDYNVQKVITGLISLGYDLSAELLTMAYSNKDENAFYYNPVFSGRLLSSQQFYDIAYGTEVSGDREFTSNVETRNEKDLHFAIKNYSFSKPSIDSRSVTIIDIYDFDSKSSKDYSEPLKSLINQILAAQEADVIIPYNLRITLNVTSYLKINLQGKTNGKWNVNIANLSSKAVNVYYNKKMCNALDAKMWQGLVDVEKINIPANSSV
ncbi:MAG TPA: hypothetical protein DDY77_00845, partial [Clostridiales bacterium]|nr:hypothetical protein [Clostridiales bacterium]